MTWSIFYFLEPEMHSRPDFWCYFTHIPQGDDISLNLFNQQSKRKVFHVQQIHLIKCARREVDFYKYRACLHLLFPAADLRPCWGQSHCQARRCSRFRWLSQRCPDHLSDPSCLWFQTCAVCHPGCPEWWLKETYSQTHVRLDKIVNISSSKWLESENNQTFMQHSETRRHTLLMFQQL